jgi:hypothetical protein
MSFRRRLFLAWCGFTALWWLWGIFGGDGSLILLKYQIGGWRAAYVHFGVTVFIAPFVPMVTLLVGIVGIRGADKIRTRRSSN